ADAVGAMRTVKYHWADKQPAAALLFLDVRTCRAGKTPRTELACVGTRLWLYAVDRTDPHGEAHVMRTVRSRALPWRLRGAPELSHIVAPITATADNHDGAIPLRALTRAFRSTLSDGHVVRHRRSVSPP